LIYFDEPFDLGAPIGIEVLRKPIVKLLTAPGTIICGFPVDLNRMTYELVVKNVWSIEPPFKDTDLIDGGFRHCIQMLGNRGEPTDVSKSRSLLF
jgi:hypothetical protein